MQEATCFNAKCPSHSCKQCQHQNKALWKLNVSDHRAFILTILSEYFALRQNVK